MLVVGALMLVIAYAAIGSWLWIFAGVLVALGLLAGRSQRVI